MIQCYRCGYCCKHSFVTIPKYIDSNLSPDFIEELESNDFDYASRYLDEHSEVVQNGRCKWLKDEDDGTTTCTAYARRNSECRDYPGTPTCFAGRIRIERLKINK